MKAKFAAEICFSFCKTTQPGSECSFLCNKKQLCLDRSVLLLYEAVCLHIHIFFKVCHFTKPSCKSALTRYQNNSSICMKADIPIKYTHIFKSESEKLKLACTHPGHV